MIISPLSRTHNPIPHWVANGNLEELKGISLTQSMLNENYQCLKIEGLHFDDEPLLFEYNLLEIACINGQAEMVEYLISCGADVSKINPDRHFPLYLAAYAGHLDTVRVLYEHDTYIDDAIEAVEDDGVHLALFEEDQTALHAAARGKHDSHAKAICSFLIEKGFSLDIQDSGGFTPLHHAIRAGNKLTAQLLIELGADVNLGYDPGSNHAIHGYGAESDYFVRYTHPLYTAVSLGHLDLAELLIKHGAKLDNEGFGETLLNLAAMNPNGLKLVEWLIEERNFDPKAHNNMEVDPIDRYMNENGSTPLHRAANKVVAEYLIYRGADIHAKDGKGQTPLMTQCILGNDDVFHLLLSLGARFDGDIHDYFVSAIVGGNINILTYLFDHFDIDPNKVFEDKNYHSDEVWFISPLMLAAQRGHADVVTFLLAKGAKVDTKMSIKNKPHNPHVQTNSYPLTALDFATTSETAKALLQKGAFKYVTNKTRLFKKCVESNNHELLKVLLRYGLPERGLNDLYAMLPKVRANQKKHIFAHPQDDKLRVCIDNASKILRCTSNIIHAFDDYSFGRMGRRQKSGLVYELYRFFMQRQEAVLSCMSGNEKNFINKTVDILLSSLHEKKRRLDWNLLMSNKPESHDIFNVNLTNIYEGINLRNHLLEQLRTIESMIIEDCPIITFGRLCAVLPNELIENIVGHIPDYQLYGYEHRLMLSGSSVQRDRNVSLSNLSTMQIGDNQNNSVESDEQGLSYDQQEQVRHFKRVKHS